MHIRLRPGVYTLDGRGKTFIIPLGRPLEVAIADPPAGGTQVVVIVGVRAKYLGVDSVEVFYGSPAPVGTALQPPTLPEDFYPIVEMVA